MVKEKTRINTSNPVKTRSPYLAVAVLVYAVRAACTDNLLRAADWLALVERLGAAPSVVLETRVLPCVRALKNKCSHSQDGCSVLFNKPHQEIRQRISEEEFRQQWDSQETEQLREYKWSWWHEGWTYSEAAVSWQGQSNVADHERGLNVECDCFLVGEDVVLAVTNWAANRIKVKNGNISQNGFAYSKEKQRIILVAPGLGSKSFHPFLRAISVASPLLKRMIWIVKTSQ